MDLNAFLLLLCGLPLIAFCLGVMIGLLLAMWRMDERATGRHPSMPTGNNERFQAESRLKPFKRSHDMLTEDETKKP